MAYISKAYTIAQVVGDVETREGKNGKTYRTVPVEMLGNRKAHAFVNYVPEMQSYVMIEVTGRADNLSYSVVSPTVQSVKFLADACKSWNYNN